MAQLRVTGGELKGRRLYVPGRGVRPTTGRVREALFSMLGDVSGLSVLDLFCGSGALGIEALSRGAAEAVFVDRKASAVARNLDDLGITEPDAEWGWQVVRDDVLDFLESRAILEPRRYDLIFCDPPYSLGPALAVGLDIWIPGAVAAGGRLVLETDPRNPLNLSHPLVKERTYGDTMIRIHTPKPISLPAEEAR